VLRVPEPGSLPPWRDLSLGRSTPGLAGPQLEESGTFYRYSYPIMFGYRLRSVGNVQYRYRVESSVPVRDISVRIRMRIRISDPIFA
jgi:hypothetical protein